MKKIINTIKWFFSFSLKRVLTYLAKVKISKENFYLLEKAYLFQKHNLDKEE